MAQLAHDFRAVAASKPALAGELHSVSDRVEAVARHGRAAIGFFEYVPAEAEGHRRWLVDLENTDEG